MKKLILSLLGIKFREYPLWWKIMTMSVTVLIITYTYFINLYSHLIIRLMTIIEVPIINVTECNPL